MCEYEILKAYFLLVWQLGGVLDTMKYLFIWLKSLWRFTETFIYFWCNQRRVSVKVTNQRKTMHADASTQGHWMVCWDRKWIMCYGFRSREDTTRLNIYGRTTLNLEVSRQHDESEGLQNDSREEGQNAKIVKQKFAFSLSRCSYNHFVVPCCQNGSEDRNMVGQSIGPDWHTAAQ